MQTGTGRLERVEWAPLSPVAMRGLEEPGRRPTATPCGCVKPALETGNLLTEPIGYLESCFSAKNGTPRQPSICRHSRACLRIRKSIFNNPEHSLMGLEEFSHVWILFVFHKNGHLSCKAKVQPPRLNGAKTGVFSTRSPHRPNAIGLTLAKLEKVEGGTIYLSGIDMIHGTPVLDIKPYIADYDSPQNLIEPLGECNLQNNQNKPKIVSRSDAKTDSRVQQQLSECEEPQPCGRTKEKPTCPEHRASGENDTQHKDTAKIQQRSPKHRETADLGLESRSGQTLSLAEKQMGPCLLEKSFSEESTDKRPRRRKEAVVPQGGSGEVQPVPPHCPPRMADAAHHSVVPAWVREAPVATLQVRFTPHAEMDLEHLSSEGEPDVGRASFKYFQSAEEARHAIEAVLSADPRSAYRRKLCQDRLFYFTVDTAHVTCWFGDGFAEVLRIKPASEPVQITDPVESLVSLGS
ncbi:tRNA (adenine(37)-N6)-methyltransferase isoform X1 [Myotis myotis]|uniref:tRNA (adenine(37)-N6)-methyltransferase n=1 Tax=Myotis myotis TaxID=51298 RepID=A0A7J7URQ0_MYOMY|nr:tRNA (adenine(37)-N6)-methyltransferase isoform X1 [Myotis myotis]KAF6315580.1 tRNA methyltransferase O [Myotis myotis]